MSAIKGVPQHIGGNESRGKYSSETLNLCADLEGLAKKAGVDCFVSIEGNTCIVKPKTESRTNATVITFGLSLPLKAE